MTNEETNYVEVVMGNIQPVISKETGPGRTSLLRPALWAAATALVAVLIVLAHIAAALCVNAENRSDLFYRRCNSGLPNLPLLGLAIIILGYLLARVFKQRWIRGLALVLALVPTLITMDLFRV